MIVLLSAEQQWKVAEIAVVVRYDEETVRRWLHRYVAEGIQGLADAPRSGAPPKVTTEYRKKLLSVAAGGHAPWTCLSRCGRNSAWPTIWRS